VAQAVKLVLATALLFLVLIQPNHPGALTWGALRLFPLELPVLVLGLIALPRWRWLCTVLALALVAVAVLKLADFALFVAFGRGFNPVTDWNLIDAGWRLGAGALGVPLAVLAALALVVLLAGLVLGLRWALLQWSAVRLPPPARLGTGAAAVAALALAVAEIGQARQAWTLPFEPPGAAFTARVAWERVGMIRATRADLAAFRAAAASDTLAAAPGQLAALQGREVIVVFVESYARASLDNPLYAPSHRQVLAAAEGKLAAAGLAVRSGLLVSPIEGGQSWLAHATLATGLRVDGPVRYAALLASPRQTLWQIAQAAGYRTAAVMPAISMAWPEGARLGFDVALDAGSLGYAGPAFNWITMPDQFTLAAFRDRLPPDGRPLFAMVALVSSHAPWVPVPALIPWDEIGDGRVFARFTEGAPTPREVWADQDRIRAQYGLSIAYALETVFDWAARQGPDGPLVVILGDHPPVQFVSGSASREVPVHLVGPPAALAAFDGWDWAGGTIPGGEAILMEDFRDRFLTALRAAP
jgi:hypothetical protein